MPAFSRFETVTLNAALHSICKNETRSLKSVFHSQAYPTSSVRLLMLVSSNFACAIARRAMGTRGPELMVFVLSGKIGRNYGKRNWSE
jgi:hypothetical protein